MGKITTQLTASSKRTGRGISKNMGMKVYNKDFLA
uniref:Uncharacterized protein n=1 Tax=Anguilla anguilla TaxID=7936 RepID=A0A0E9T464_ANGAN